jgi:phosphatidylserine/phosphatidylglycerophosphate/cardiolipin synthase-like enzyme
MTSAAVELVVDAAHLDRVVRRGIAKASVSLDIMTADFKAMLIPGPRGGRVKSIVTVMRDLVERGVEIRLLHAGVPSSAALVELRKTLPERLTIRRCPRLHAKAVIVDCQAMYLGSANLTGAGLGAKGAKRRNFELGIWTTNGSMIDAVSGYFNALWEGTHCEGCGRRNICPEPLEEPELA